MVSSPRLGLALTTSCWDTVTPGSSSAQQPEGSFKAQVSVTFLCKIIVTSRTPSVKAEFLSFVDRTLCEVASPFISLQGASGPLHVLLAWPRALLPCNSFPI